MAGQIVGIDYAAALLLAPSCHQETFIDLLTVAEQGMLAGVAKQRAD